MSLLALVLVPLAGAAAAGLDPSRRRRLLWLIAAAAVHAALVALAWSGRVADTRVLWLAFDPLGGLMLTLVSAVFLAIAVHGAAGAHGADPRGGRAYEACLLGFLAAATVASLTGHFGALWVAMEATTLATAPLIYDPRDRHSIEAVWKYLLIGSVGIALALLGTFLLALAQGAATGTPDLLRSAIGSGAPLHPVWFQAAFVFLFVGYGTKAGLAPMHTWLPDAHGEAPAPISALLSGALINLALLAVLRVLQVAHATGQAALLAPVLVGFGFASVLIATALLLRQRNYKRMLAYSSVEHMGLVAAGFGLGPAAAFGAVLHVLGSALCKAMLFLVAGNTVAAYGSKRIADVTGLMRRLPASGVLFVAGFFALTGAPPFPLFLSRLAILRGAFQSGQVWVAAGLAILHVIAFVALGARVIAMTRESGTGASGAIAAAAPRERFAAVAAPAALLLAALALGFAPPFHRAVAAAAATLGGVAP